MPPIRAPRLSDGEVGLRGLAASDIPAIVEACRDTEIPRWTRVPSPYLREDAERFLGYWIAAPARGRGAATRAVRLLRDWAQQELGLDALEILAHTDNRASQRVAAAAGFVDTGEIRSAPRMPPHRRHGYKVFAWRAAPA